MCRAYVNTVALLTEVLEAGWRGRNGEVCVKKEGVWGEGSLIALLKGGNEGSERMSGARTEARTNTLSLLNSLNKKIL